MRLLGYQSQLGLMGNVKKLEEGLFWWFIVISLGLFLFLVHHLNLGI
jgi:hypothetical protein